MRNEVSFTIFVPVTYQWTIIPEGLQAKIEEETNRPEFSSLPFHYLEVAHLLLDW